MVESNSRQYLTDIQQWGVLEENLTRLSSEIAELLEKP